MKKRVNPVWIGVILILILQLACTIADTLPDYFCEMNGGTWHPATMEEDAWCERAKPNPEVKPEAQDTNPTGGEAGVNPPTEGTEEYIPPTNASAQDCNATLYIHTEVELIKDSQEPYVRECEYKLTGNNIHSSEGIWIVRRTNVNTHAPPKDCDTCYWYSDLLFPGQAWEKTFRATFFNDGQAGFEYVDRVAGVFNRPACLYLLNSPEIESISTPVEWACSP